jgi:hypothetical protein
MWHLKNCPITGPDLPTIATSSPGCDTQQTVPDFALSLSSQHYDPLMREAIVRHRNTLLLLAVLGTAAYALGQTDDSLATPDLPRQIAVARCAYAQSENACGANPSQDTGAQDGSTAQARFPGRIPRPPMAPRRQMGYPRAGYPSPWMGEGHPGHALIGALVGGGVGAAAGINIHTNNQSGPNVVGAIVLGGLGAMVGGIIGNSVPWTHGQRLHRVHGRTMMNSRPVLSLKRRIRTGVRPHDSPANPSRPPAPIMPLRRSQSRLEHPILQAGKEPRSPLRHLILNAAFWGQLPLVTIPVRGSLSSDILPVFSAVAGVEASPQRRNSQDGT